MTAKNEQPRCFFCNRFIAEDKVNLRYEEGLEFCDVCVIEVDEDIAKETKKCDAELQAVLDGAFVPFWDAVTVTWDNDVFQTVLTWTSDHMPTYTERYDDAWDLIEGVKGALLRLCPDDPPQMKEAIAWQEKWA